MTKFDDLFEKAKELGYELRIVAFTEPLGDEPRIPHFVDKLDDGGDLSLKNQLAVMQKYLDSDEAKPKKTYFEKYFDEMGEINNDINFNMLEVYKLKTDVLDLYRLLKADSRLQEAEFIAVYGKDKIPEGKVYQTENFQKINRVYRFLDNLLIKAFENPMTRIIEREKGEREKNGTP